MHAVILAISPVPIARPAIKSEAKWAHGCNQEEIAATCCADGRGGGAGIRCCQTPGDQSSSGVSARSGLPDNDQVEAAVREYIALFCADTQPGELRALRELALVWMERLDRFRPHLAGAVWHGTALRSDIYIQLFCDDPKSAEIGLIDMGVRFEVTTVNGFQGQPVDALSLHLRCAPLGGVCRAASDGV